MMTTCTFMRLTILILLAITLTGCKLLDGLGGDSSEAMVERSEKCKFDLRQAARVSGEDDADVVETVSFDPDCNVQIRFRQTTGDTVSEIENEGGEQILGQGVTPAAPEPEPEDANEQ